MASILIPVVDKMTRMTFYCFGILMHLYRLIFFLFFKKQITEDDLNLLSYRKGNLIPVIFSFDYVFDSERLKKAFVKLSLKIGLKEDQFKYIHRKVSIQPKFNEFVSHDEIYSSINIEVDRESKEGFVALLHCLEDTERKKSILLFDPPNTLDGLSLFNFLKTLLNIYLRDDFDCGDIVKQKFEKDFIHRIDVYRCKNRWRILYKVFRNSWLNLNDISVVDLLSKKKKNSFYLTLDREKTQKVLQSLKSQNLSFFDYTFLKFNESVLQMESRIHKFFIAFSFGRRYGTKTHIVIGNWLSGFLLSSKEYKADIREQLNQFKDKLETKDESILDAVICKLAMHNYGLDSSVNPINLCRSYCLNSVYFNNYGQNRISDEFNPISYHWSPIGRLIIAINTVNDCINITISSDYLSKTSTEGIVKRFHSLFWEDI